MSSSADQHQKAVAMHRRQTWLYIAFPAAAGVLLIVAVLAVVLFFPQRLQVSIVADVALVVFMLCPAVLCLIPLTLLLVVSAWGMNLAHTSAARATRRVEEASAVATQRAISLTNQIDQKTITISARFGVLMKGLGLFDRPDSQDDKGGTP